MLRSSCTTLKMHFAFHASETKLAAHCVGYLVNGKMWDVREAPVENFRQGFRFNIKNYDDSFFRAIKPGEIQLQTFK